MSQSIKKIKNIRCTLDIVKPVLVDVKTKGRVGKRMWKTGAVVMSLIGAVNLSRIMTSMDKFYIVRLRRLVNL